MRWSRTLLRRLRFLLRRSTAEDEMDEELGFHVDMETRKHIRAGRHTTGRVTP